VCSLNAAQRSSVCGPLLTSACDVHTHLRVYKHPHVAPGTPKAQTVFAVYEVAHTAVDFGAAICFLVGSVLFLYKKYETPAVWLFIVLLRQAHPEVGTRDPPLAHGSDRCGCQRRARVEASVADFRDLTLCSDVGCAHQGPLLRSRLLAARLPPAKPFCQPWMRTNFAEE
jgi:hypothetical protein